MENDANRIRSVDPLVWPQYPFNEPPKVPEKSEPRYSIFSDHEARIPMRDGIRIAADVLRPYAVGKFPALVSTSVYTRQLHAEPLTLLPRCLPAFLIGAEKVGVARALPVRAIAVW